MEENTTSPEKKDPPPAAPARGWGGWGISPLSMFSDLQKAAAVAAEEISRNATEVAKTAAKGIQDIQNVAPDTETLKEEEPEKKADDEVENEDDKLRKSTLDKLENASEDSLLGQGLKVLDNSVETLASGAWQALGSAWRGGSLFVQKIENSATSLAVSIQSGDLPAKAGSLAPSLMESGKAFTTKGIQVLEHVGKETMDLLISEAGIEVEKNVEEADQETDGEQFEEVTFDRCFYIYGGPEQLEELEALSNHYSLLFNRRKTKLSSEQKSLYDATVKKVQQIFSLSTEMDAHSVDPDKGKNIETVEGGSSDEMKVLRDASVNKAADMAAGFAAALGGLSTKDIVQRTADRLETIHSEGVHRLSELCCNAVSQLLMLGKSIISSANKTQEEISEDDVKITWPEDPISRAKIIRTKTQSMTGDIETVSDSFITGISDVVEAYIVAMKGASTDAHGGLSKETSLQQKADAISGLLRTNQTTARDKIQDGLQYLTFTYKFIVILPASTSTRFSRRSLLVVYLRIDIRNQ
ncbi:hypothetical protein H6P81_020930 [Aristolochia fimbriata]|uniref:DUF7798 domain-containing protein n=1 Tax=Aristolochia fimbriata TaxID=158543 RepID=A0AAV7DVT5_ARIFI|nr:hypothetical protein H6P81_020930 [Aristolochia fimbriata]